MMTGKERILAALRGEETDRLCWAPLIDTYFTSSLPKQGYEELDIPDACRLVGADIVERHSPTVRRVDDPAIIRRVERKGNVQREIIETPVGSLTSEKHFIAKDSGHVTKYPLTTIEEVKIYQYIMERVRHEEDFAAFRERERLIGHDGLATSSGPLPPMTDLLEELGGVENTYYFLMDHPEALEACIEVMHEKNKEMYRLICDSPTQVVIDYEDTSSTLISPTYYRQYCAPLIDDYADICHDAGKWFLTHMCGKLKTFNKEIKAGRQDGVESVCPPTSGDTWAHEARAAWGPEKIIMGGLEPAALERMSVDETRKYVSSVLDQMPTFRNFILCTGDATAHGTPVINLRAVTEIVADYAWK